MLQGAQRTESQLHNKRRSAELEDIFIDREYIRMKDEVSFHICQQFAACDHFSTCILSMFYVVSIWVLEVAVLLVSSGEVIQISETADHFNKTGRSWWAADLNSLQCIFERSVSPCLSQLLELWDTNWLEPNELARLRKSLYYTLVAFRAIEYHQITTSESCSIPQGYITVMDDYSDGWGMMVIFLTKS